MSGETDAAVSGWTVDTLKHHFEVLLTERDHRFTEKLTEKDKRDEQRYVAQQEGVDRALMAAEKAVNAALAAADRAISKAEDASERRLNILNEFRTTVENLVKAAPTRNEMEPRFEALSSRLSVQQDEHQRSIGELKQTLATTAGRDKGVALAYSVATGAVFLVIAVLGFALARGGP